MARARITPPIKQVQERLERIESLIKAHATYIGILEGERQELLTAMKVLLRPGYTADYGARYRRRRAPVKRRLVP